jgi:hypothetical protein
MAWWAERRWKSSLRRSRSVLQFVELAVGAEEDVDRLGGEGTSYCVSGALATLATTPMMVLLCLPGGTW